MTLAQTLLGMTLAQTLLGMTLAQTLLENHKKESFQG
jgi:hypothetical protein